MNSVRSTNFSAGNETGVLREGEWVVRAIAIGSIELASLIAEYRAVADEHDHTLKQFGVGSIDRRKDLLRVCRRLLRRARTLQEMAKVRSEMDQTVMRVLRDPHSDP